MNWPAINYALSDRGRLATIMRIVGSYCCQRVQENRYDVNIIGQELGMRLVHRR